MSVAAFVLAATIVPARAEAAQDASRLLTAGEAAVARADYETATRLLAGLLDSAALTNAERARAYQLLASVQVERGDHDAAIASAARAESLAREPRDSALLARVAIVRGHVRRNQGAILEAVSRYRDALGLAEEAGNPGLAAAAHLALSSGYTLLGDWSRVLDHADRGFALDPAPTPAARINHLLQRGIALFEFHDRGRAERAFEDALALARARQDRRNQAFALGELGLLHWEIDRDRERALSEFAQAIDLAHTVGVPQIESGWINNQANVFRDSGEPERALRGYREALALAERHGLGRNVPAFVKNIGQTLRLLGRREEAERYLLQALDLADRQADPRRQWESRMELGELYRDADPARAAGYFRESLDLIEARHSNVLLENFRAGALGRTLEAYNPYDLYIDFLLDRRESREAFVVAERARARAFLDTLSLAREQLGGGVPAGVLEAENRALREISRLQASLRAGTLSGDARTQTLAAIEKAETDLTETRLRLANEHPALVQARYPRLWTTDALQRDVLGRADVLILFFLGRTGSAVWRVSRDRVDVTRLPPEDVIAARVRPYLEALGSPSSTLDRAAVTALTALLLPGAESWLPPSGRVIIVPHGILQYLPFEALVRSNGRYLVEDSTISYAPSAASYAYLTTAPDAASARPELLAVGNPVFTKAAGLASARASQLEWVDRLAPLPHAREELQAIAATFGSAVRMLDAADATEDALSAALSDRVGIVHFATHGLIDEQQPDRSGLALTADPPASDGILQMREIYRLRLNRALVTLSACQTALGRSVTGEGLVGLARAFFYAGADAVVASLWNVNDAAAAQWMAIFYERLHGGATVADAMRDTKLRYITSGTALAHPSYWAPFVVSGDAALRPVNPGRLTRATVMASAAGLLALVAGAVIWGRRRRSAARTRAAAPPAPVP